MATTWLLPELMALREAHPGLSLELFLTPEELDLVGGKADVALRMDRPTQAGLVARRLATVERCVAASPALAAMEREVWRSAREELARAPRIKAVTDWLDEVFARRAMSAGASSDRAH